MAHPFDDPSYEFHRIFCSRFEFADAEERDKHNALFAEYEQKLNQLYEPFTQQCSKLMAELAVKMGFSVNARQSTDVRGSTDTGFMVTDLEAPHKLDS